MHGDNSLFLVSSTSIVEFTIDLKCRNIISSKEIITHQKFGKFYLKFCLFIYHYLFYFLKYKRCY